MLIKAKIFEHYNRYNFKIPLTGGERLYVKNQQEITTNDSLFSKSENQIKGSYFLVDELNCGPSECSEYISCIDGEYIDKGAVLAEKQMSKGLSVKRVLSKEAGVVDLERIEQGFIDILGEEEQVTVNSKFKGIVIDILPGSHIAIQSPASALDLAATTHFKKKLFGDIEILNKESKVISDIPKVNLKGKIVWVGPYLPINLALQAFQRGARGVLAYSMEYDDFKGLGLPIGIIEGFGKIHCDEKFLKEFYKIDGKFAVIDSEEDQLFVAKERQTEQTPKEFFVRELLGAQVISRHSSHYGYIGTIIQINDLNYVTVDFGTSGKSIVDLGSLDFISM
jgi:hypothetical protein